MFDSAFEADKQSVLYSIFSHAKKNDWEQDEDNQFAILYSLEVEDAFLVNW